MKGVLVAVLGVVVIVQVVAGGALQRLGVVPTDSGADT